MIWSDIDEVYTGNWLDDKPHGFGEHIWGDTSSKSLFKQLCNVYRGFWLNGLREGQGTFFYANGTQYTGYDTRTKNKDMDYLCKLMGVSFMVPLTTTKSYLAKIIFRRCLCPDEINYR